MSTPTPEPLQIQRVADLYRIPWLPRGRTAAGADCVGFVLLYAQLRGYRITEIQTPEDRALATRVLATLLEEIRGPLTGYAEHAIFLANREGQISHVGVVLSGGRVMHSTAGGVRVDNGTRLLERCGLYPVGVIPLTDSARVSAALSAAGLGSIESIITAIIVSLVMTAVSVALMPKRPAIGTQAGRYGFDSLVTSRSAEVAVPDVLGTVTLAGNEVFRELMDRTLEVTDPAQQKASSVVVFAAGPVAGLGDATFEIRINGLAWDNNYWFGGDTTGFELNPAQTEAEAMDGTIGTDTHKPSMTLYTGEPALEVPLDVRADYIRDFPLYGFNGCAYAVFRLVDSTKYSQFNVTARITGRECRTYTSAGWDTEAVVAESLAGADGDLTRWKLAHHDIAAVSSLTVNGDPYTEIGPGNQTGDVYHLNHTKGIVEFITAPPASATIAISYTYYPRAHTSNPADHILYLLTEVFRGKGMPEDRIDWESFAAAAAYFDESIDIVTDTGTVTQARYRSNYAVDVRRGVQEHIREILTACQSVLLISGGRLKLKPIRDEESVFSFTPDNILADSFHASLLDRADRANFLKVTYHDAVALNAETAVQISDIPDQRDRADRTGNLGIVESALKFPAVDNAPQAYHIARMILGRELGSDWGVEFTTTIKGLGLEPGDIIDVTHPAKPGWDAKEFRIEETELDTDDRMLIRATEYVPEITLGDRLWTFGEITTSLWLDASHPWSLALSSGLASEWRDRSGNGRNFTASGSARPTLVAGSLNSRDFLTFNGSSNVMTLGSSGLLRNRASMMAFLVLRWNASPTAQQIALGISRGGATAARFAAYGGTPSGKSQVGARRLDADSFQQVSSAASISVGAWSTVAVRIDYQARTLRQYLNGVIDGQTTTFQTAGNTSDTDSFGASVGAGASGQWANASIAEIAVVPEDLGDATFAKALGYLHHKHGIEDLLPVSHAHRSAWPTV